MRNILYVSDEKNLDNYLQKYVKENFQNGKFISNKNVIYYLLKYDDIFVSKNKRFSDYSGLRENSNTENIMTVEESEKDIINKEEKCEIENLKDNKKKNLRIKLKKKCNLLFFIKQI